MNGAPEFFIDMTGLYDSRFLFRQEEGEETKDRTVEFYEMEIFSEDGGFAFVDGREYPIKSGFALVCKPGQRRHSRLHFRAHYIHLSVSRPTVRSMIDALPAYFRISPTDKYIDIINRLAVASCREFYGKELYINANVSKFLYMLVSDAANTGASFDRDDDKRLIGAKKFIDNNFDKPINLSDIAASVNLSPIYFHNKFCQFAGNICRSFGFPKPKTSFRFPTLPWRRSLFPVDFRPSPISIPFSERKPT